MFFFSLPLTGTADEQKGMHAWPLHTLVSPLHTHALLHEHMLILVTWVFSHSHKKEGCNPVAPPT